MNPGKLQGRVKWFDKEKGYGFITDYSNTDYYFHVKSVIGADLPKQGMIVGFIPGEGSKGPRAESIEIDLTQAPEPKKDRRDDRVECSSCNRRMVPRIITSDGQLSKSVCPFCGAVYKDFVKPNCLGFVIFLVAIGIIALLASID